MTKDMRDQINRFVSAFDAFKEKFERSLNIFSGISEGVKYVGSYLMDRRSERRAASPRKKKTEKVKEEPGGEADDQEDKEE